MSVSTTRSPLIRQGWLRVIPFFLFYALLLISTGFLASLAISTITKKPSQEAVTLVHQAPWLYLVIVFTGIISTLLVLLFRKLIDRKTLSSLGLPLQNNGASAALGFFTGIFILGAGTLLLYYNNNLSWTDLHVNGQSIFIEIVAMAMVAFYEEIVFRGYILNNLLQSMNKWAALFVSAVLFSILHATNPNFTSISLINIFLAGILLGINYIYTHNLWYGILLHFSWNFLQGAILGYKVSGATTQTLLEQERQGNALFTGGIFGFEGSVVCTALTALTILVFAFVYYKKHQPTEPTS